MATADDFRHLKELIEQGRKEESRGKKANRKKMVGIAIKIGDAVEELLDDEGPALEIRNKLFDMLYFGKSTVREYLESTDGLPEGAVLVPLDQQGHNWEHEFSAATLKPKSKLFAELHDSFGKAIDDAILNAPPPYDPSTYDPSADDGKLYDRISLVEFNPHDPKDLEEIWEKAARAGKTDALIAANPKLATKRRSQPKPPPKEDLSIGKWSVGVFEIKVLASACRAKKAELQHVLNRFPDHSIHQCSRQSYKVRYDILPVEIADALRSAESAKQKSHTN